MPPPDGLCNDFILTICFELTKEIVEISKMTGRGILFVISTEKGASPPSGEILRVCVSMKNNLPFLMPSPFLRGKVARAACCA